MAHQKQRPRVVQEGLLQVLEGGDVQVVGGLVQHQQVRGQQHGLGQQEPVALAAREGPGHALLLVGGEAEAGEVHQHQQLLPAHLHHGGALGDVVGHGKVRAQFAPALGDGRYGQFGVPLDGAGGGFQLAQEELQERRLPAAVGPQEGDALAALEHQVDAPGQLDPGAGVVEADALRRQERIRAVGAPGEGEAGALLQAGAVLHLVAQVQHVLDAQLGLAGAGLGAAAEPGQLPAQAVLHVLGEPGLPELLVAALQEVVAVGAFVAGDVAVLQLQHAVHDAVQEVAVVGDEQQRAAEALEPELELLHLLGVQVVGGLVQHHDVRVLQPGLGQGHPLAPAAGERLHRGFQVHQAPGGLGLLEPRLQVPAHVVEVVLHAVQLHVEPLGLVGGGGLQGLVDLPVAGDEGPVVPQGRLQGAAHRGVRGEVRVLGQVGHPQPLGEDHLALVGRVLPGQELEERRLPGPVAADEAHLLPHLQAEGQPLEDGLGAEALGDLDETEGDGHGDS